MQRRPPERRYSSGSTQPRRTVERRTSPDSGYRRPTSRDPYTRSSYDSRRPYSGDSGYGYSPRRDSGYERSAQPSRSARPPRNAQPTRNVRLPGDPMPLVRLIALDMAVFVAAMLLFALVHHVIPRDEEIVGYTATVLNTATPAPAVMPQTDPSVEAQTDEQTGETEPTAEPQPTEPLSTPAPMHNTRGIFTDKFADHFSNGTVTMDENGYRSANLDIRCSVVQTDTVRYYVADIYISDIGCITTAFGQGKFGKNHTDWPADLAKSIGAVMAINGDFYGLRTDGIVIRNGMLYRDDEYPIRDLCILYYDGVMETYDAGQFNATDAVERGAYQSWNFGPRLLDDNGQPMTEFNSDVKKTNPRTAIGYYEPGHYCFVVVDGRSKSTSGMTMEELSRLMFELGCKAAYNLDGGQTSAIVYGGKVVNKPVSGGRRCSDIIALIELP